MLNHYTMSLWATEKDMVEFSTSGAHLDAMKHSVRKKIFKENKFLTLDSMVLLGWEKAKNKLNEKGHSVNT